VPLRPIPKDFQVPPALPLRSGLSLELDVNVATVLYGGGAEAGRNDSFDPFRIPSIRGQLRFWWRATRGGAFENSEELRAAEAQIWGDTVQASAVKLRILSAQPGVEKPAARPRPDGRGWDDEQPRYVLFPAQENRKNVGRIYTGGSFRLEVRAPEPLIADVDSALWAWFAFGGIGGRTRRGCGSLYCKTYAHTWKAEAMLGDGLPRGWPTLKGGTGVMGTKKSPWANCWQECIDMLQTFRQDRPRPRARSKWPEPDEIRRIRETHASNHEPVNLLRGFPRAALGLPILFHFKTPGDPEQNTLNVVDSDDVELRMASPVILKPFAVSATEAVPLLLVLNTQPLKSVQGVQLVLKQKRGVTEKIAPPDPAPVLRRLVEFAKTTWQGQEYPL
jgi:CRISPR-associated protein Cmr1